MKNRARKTVLCFVVLGGLVVPEVRGSITRSLHNEDSGLKVKKKKNTSKATLIIFRKSIQLVTYSNILKLMDT